MDLIAGATGYVGGRLTERLREEGRPVRALARRDVELRGVEAVRGDLVAGTGIERALDGVETAYYLVHSMEPPAGASAANGNGSFGARARLAARNFATAAANAGVERIVYLGGIVPSGAAISPHLKS